MTRAVLALGSNLGQREATIVEAVRRIAELPGVEVLAASTLRETAALTPDGVDDQAPAYINAVILAQTRLAPEALLDAVHAIESDLGRVRAERWADRTIDIDLIDVGGMRITTDKLTLPHPRAAERRFVLEPWLEVDPGAHLGDDSVADLLTKLELG